MEQWPLLLALAPIPTVRSITASAPLRLLLGSPLLFYLVDKPADDYEYYTSTITLCTAPNTILQQA